MCGEEREIQLRNYARISLRRRRRQILLIIHVLIDSFSAVATELSLDGKSLRFKRDSK